MHHFSSLLLKFSQQFQLQEHRFKQHQNAPTLFLISKCSQQFQLPKNCFKQRQNAPFCVFVFNIFSAVPTSEKKFLQRQNAPSIAIAFNIFSSVSTSKNIVQNVQECTFQCSQFQNFLSCDNFGLQVSALGNEQTCCHL